MVSTWTIWFQISALPLTVHVNQKKFLKLFVPQSLHLQNRDDNNNITGLLYKGDSTDKQFKRILSLS